MVSRMKTHDNKNVPGEMRRPLWTLKQQRWIIRIEKEDDTANSYMKHNEK